jgi:hypothetical protein
MTECSVDVWCGILSGDDTQGGFKLDPGLFLRLADLGLAVWFDVY